jgi:hypothetical protein
LTGTNFHISCFPAKPGQVSNSAIEIENRVNHATAKIPLPAGAAAEIPLSAGATAENPLAGFFRWTKNLNCINVYHQV